MNRNFTCLLIGLLLLCGMRSTAQVIFNFSPTDISANLNETVSVDITVADFTNVASVQFAFGWDDSILEFQSVTNLNADLDGLNDSHVGTPGEGNVPSNRVFFSWNHPSFANDNLADDAVLFTVNLRTIKEGVTTFEFVDDPPGIEVVDSGGNDRGFATQTQTTVTVGTGTGGGGSGGGGGGSGGGGSGGEDCTPAGFGLAFGEVSGAQGEQVVIDVKAYDFENMLSMQYSIAYDDAVLQFVDVVNTDLPGLSASGNFSNPSPGRISLSWNDPQVMGVTVADGTVIYSIRFNVLQTTPTAITLSDSPTQIEFIREGENQPLDYDICDGSVNDGGTGGGGGGGGGGSNTDCTFTGFGLKFAQIAGTQGQQVCMDVTVQDFDDMLGMQYTINYDPAVLQYESINNTNLAGLSEGGNFGNPEPGKITVFWFDQTVSGVTVADGTVIYSVCFTVLQETATTVFLGDDPTSIEFSNTQSNEAIPYTICDGSVNGEGGGGGGNTDCSFSGFGLALGEVDADQGAQACIDFAVQEFDNINGMQFTLDYDPAVLQYETVTNINLPDMSAAGNFGNPEPGKITVFWFDQTTTGVDRADGAVIFTVCFEVLATTPTSVMLSDSPTSIEFSQNNQGQTSAINYDYCPGLVNQPSDAVPPVIADAAIVAASCFNSADGSVTLTMAVEGDYSYAWSRGNSTTNVAGGLRSGAISVTVTDNESGLTVMDTYNISSPSAVAVNANIVQVSCIGANNGSIVITATGGSGSLSYSWQPGGSTSSTLEDLAPGSYSLTITDANNCTNQFGPYVITEPSQDITVNESIVDVVCSDDETGSISLNISGGTPNYRIDWSGGLLDNVTNQTSLRAGTYRVTITDARNCTKSFEYRVRSQNPAIQISAVPTHIGDDSDGAVSITASGGTGAFSYSWTGPGNFSSSAEDLSGLSQPGEYCLTITDEAGCRESVCVTINIELVISDFVINKPCDSGNNGSIEITVAGGTTPYTYRWERVGSAGVISTQEDLTNIGPGTYNVTVTDATNVETTGNFEVVSESPQIEASISPSTPGGSTGSIELDIPGNSSDYTISWDNGATTATISDLAVGQYCVTITFSGGCIYEACYQVSGEAFMLVNFSSTDATCAGDNSGSLNLRVRGGKKPYTLLMASETYSSEDGVFLIDGLSAGTMEFTVSDADGNSESRQITINEPASISYEAVVVHDTEDAGCTGSITLQIAGGAGPYMIEWNGEGLTGQQVIVCGFNYTAVITDSRGCVVTTDPISVTTFSEEANITKATCPGDENAAIDLSVSGGDESSPYTFAWRESPDGPIISTDEDLTNIGEGTYYVQISEASGNTLTRSYVIDTESSLTIQATVETDYNGFGVSCADANDGTLAAVVTNANGAIEYEWMLDGAVVGTSATLSNARGGAYVLRVIDESCISEIDVNLSAPDLLTVEALNIKPVGCTGLRDGAIVVQGQGGAPPYIYRWSNNDFGQEIDFLGAGSYTVTVTDRNNCMIVSTYEVATPTPLEVLVMTEPATNQLGSECNGSVRAVVSGGQEPYNYRWININNQDENMVTGLCPGEYIVEVTDALGCPPITANGIVRDRTLPCFSTRTVITPDGDGLNETFIIFCSDEYPSNRLVIYNRWGQLVYETENYDCTKTGGKCFTGTTPRGEPLPEGAYYWVLEYTDTTSGELVQLKGSLTILSE